MFWTFKNLAAATQGQWLTPPEDATAPIPAALRDTGPILWHDTREITEGQIYLAITGENFDGHDFIDKAFEAGAALAIVEKQPPSLEGGAGGRLASDNDQPNSTKPILQVEDTVKALQQLARAYRDELKAGGCTVIGIAGSNGKTTTRHLIHHILTHAGKRGTQSPKSFNNHLGVPLTLLAARPEDDFVAAEIGTNHPGEIDFLSEIAKPDIAVISSIGEEHLEFFKDLEGVAKEEASLSRHICNGGSLILGRGVCEIASEHIDWTKGADVIMNDECFSSEALYLPPHFETRGPHFWPNAWNAATVANLFGIEDREVKTALRAYKSEFGRMQVHEFGSNIKLINDAYNANPTSMTDMVEWFADQSEEASRLVLIVGDMLELGDSAQAAHQQLGTTINCLSKRIDTDGEGKLITIGVGPLCFANLPKGGIQVGFPELLFKQLDQSAASEIVERLEPGDTVLLKASRGMRLERLIPAIEKRFGKVEK